MQSNTMPDEIHCSTQKKDVVVFQEAFKTYGRGKKANVVLRNFRMTVPQGSVYALLGPSGCGKTSVLTCITGQRSLDAGQALVFGSKPSRVPKTLIGYTPQERGVSKPITIEEMMFYFGRIHGMPTEQIKIKSNFFYKLLQLPPKDRHIYTLSGGQQKRLSLAVSFLHEPKLLILDEPTVGLDPVLRQIIWKYLQELASQDVTIILTTHYTQEALLSHVMGFMRSGRLLVETDPKSLMLQNRGLTLDDICLSFCSGDEMETRAQDGSGNQAELSTSTPVEEAIQPVSETRSFVVPNFKDEEKKSRWTHRVGAMLRHNYTRLVRNYIPTIIIMNMSFTILAGAYFAFGSKPLSLNLGVVNHEAPRQTMCTPVDYCSFNNLSCRYLNTLDHEVVNLLPYDDATSAETAVQSGYLVGFILFPTDYSEALVRRSEQGININNTDNALKNSVVHLRLNTTGYISSGYVQHMVLFRFIAFMKEVFGACYDNGNLIETAVAFGEPIFGKADPEFAEFFIPAQAINLVFAVTMVVAGAIFIWEVEDGIIDRITVSGVKYWEMITSLLLTVCSLSIYSTTGLIIITYLLLGVYLSWSVLEVFLLILLQCVCASCLGIFVALLLPDVAQSTLVYMSVFILNEVMCGSMWPLEGVSNYVRWLCYMSPVTLPSSAIRSMLNRGWSIYHWEVALGFVSSLSWTLVYLFLIFLVLKRR